MSFDSLSLSLDVFTPPDKHQFVTKLYSNSVIFPSNNK